MLLVDDDPDIVDLFSIVLEAHGYVCTVATTGHRAIELVEGFRPDIILLDLGLPDLDGYQVARCIRSIHGKTILIVAVTGWNQREHRERALAAGIDLHVTKPVSGTRIKEILVTAMASPRDTWA